MPHYSARSESRLQTVAEPIQRVMRFVLKRFDHTILEGHRDQLTQDAAFVRGASTKQWPNSKHNQLPSAAVDAAPYYPEVPAGGIDWRTDAALLAAAKSQDWVAFMAILENVKRWHTFGGYVLGAGNAMDVQIRWGGDWDLDFHFNDQTLIDLPHFELVGR